MKECNKSGFPTHDPQGKSALNPRLEVQTFDTVTRPLPKEEHHDTIAPELNSGAVASIDVLGRHQSRSSFVSRLPNPFDTANSRYELERRIGSQVTGRDEVHCSYLCWK